MSSPHLAPGYPTGPEAADAYLAAHGLDGDTTSVEVVLRADGTYLAVGHQPVAVKPGLPFVATDETHTDETMFKVDAALRRAGLLPDHAAYAIDEMQNAGILFREHTTTTTSDGLQVFDGQNWVPAPYDSRADTLVHAQRVAELMGDLIIHLIGRSTCHDHSKTVEPELAIFNEFTPKLKHTTYGSDEYKAHLEAMGEGLRHHYDVNRHHPEHFRNGIAGMTLVDLIEMLADWKAATERHADGDLARSLEIQRDRFGIAPQLLQILHNTAQEYGWLPNTDAAPLEHPEAQCHRCGRQFIGWVAPSPLWNAVMRGGSINGNEPFRGIICPSCFADLAQQAGIASGWRFHATEVSAELETVTPSGRVWNEKTWMFEAPQPACDCGGLRVHTITCATVAAGVPYALKDADDFVYYPDDRADADKIREMFPTAAPVNPDAFTAWYDAQA